MKNYPLLRRNRCLRIRVYPFNISLFSIGIHSIKSIGYKVNQVDEILSSKCQACYESYASVNLMHLLAKNFSNSFAQMSIASAHRF